MANKFVYCVCFALAISHFTLPFDVCQPEAFWFMKRVLLFQSYQEKLKIPYATFLVFKLLGVGGREGVGLAKYFMYDGQCDK